VDVPDAQNGLYGVVVLRLVPQRRHPHHEREREIKSRTDTQPQVPWTHDDILHEVSRRRKDTQIQAISSFPHRTEPVRQIHIQLGALEGGRSGTPEQRDGGGVLGRRRDTEEMETDGSRHARFAQLSVPASVELHRIARGRRGAVVRRIHRQVQHVR